MLRRQLDNYLKSGVYPFHMPGHKRNSNFGHYLSCLHHDMTEVSGLDNLHSANGILRDAMANAADFFGSDRTFFLVNGSTCGILASIAALTKRGDKIICARNCHKSVYNACSLFGLVPVYLMPKLISLPFGINGSIEPSSVRAALESSGAKVVVITSPTYEGVISDIKSIADICHSFNAVLIVDEAHGAHLGHFHGFENGAIKCGADVVIHSMHKTLGAVTQSALLHICGGGVSAEKIAQKLAIFETSSPSYLIMESIDCVVCDLQKNGKRYFSEYLHRLDDFSKGAESLKNIDIIFYGKGRNDQYDEIFAFDRGKLIISAARLGYSGTFLAKKLLEGYKIQVEMPSLNYLVAMTSYCDSDLGFERLLSALSQIDDCPCGKFIPKETYIASPPQRDMEIFEAEQCTATRVPLKRSEDRICGEFIFAYPPGIPIIVPGERITCNLLCDINNLKLAGVELAGSASGHSEYVAVID